MKIGLFFQEITLITEFPGSNFSPGSNFLLPTFLAGGKWDFPVANLLLATVNFEPSVRRGFVKSHKINCCNFFLTMFFGQLFQHEQFL